MADSHAKRLDSTRANKRTADSIVMLPVSEVRPYEKNPRKNAGAVKYVKASIEKFGFKPVGDVFLEEGIEHIEMNNY